MAKKPTFQDVARAASVSNATVSRVATGSARVNPKIAECVKRAAENLGVDLYRRSRSKVVAFILSNRNMLHSFHSHILVGTESYCVARGWNTLFVTVRYSPYAPPNELHLPQILERRDMVSGFIVAGTNSRNFLDLLTHRGIPFAILGNNVLGEWHPEKHDVVWFDDIQGAFELAAFLVSLGHRHIWFVGNTRLPWFARRYEGYCRAMRQAGLTPRLSDIDSDNNQDIGFLATKAILARGEPLTAILGGGDPTAEGVYKALRDVGLRIPEDVSVTGFNDIEAALLHPPLTTVRVFTEQVGKHLAELLLNRIESPSLPPQHFTIPTQLVKRESCQAVAESKDLPGGERPPQSEWTTAP